MDPTNLFSRIRLMAVLLLAIGVQWPAAALAQPGRPDASRDLAELQRQVEQLRRQLNQSDENPFHEAEQENSRVRSVGGQRIKRSVEPPLEDILQIRLYDLSDLFVVSPHYPARLTNEVGEAGQLAFVHPDMVPFQSAGGGMGGGGFGGGGGGVFSIPPAPPQASAGNVAISTAQVSMGQLVEAIQATVEPTRWGSDSDQARIQFLGNTLLISATEEMHTQIANLLDLFREHWGKRRTITLQTYWVQAPATAADQLLDVEHQKKVGAGAVAGDRWEDFLAHAESDDRIVFSATLTGHNNQTLHAVSGRQSLKTLDARFETNRTERIDPESETTVIEKAAVGIRPVRQVVHEGPTFQATPLATRGGNFVILDLHARWNRIPTDEVEQQIPLQLKSDVDPFGGASLKLDAGQLKASRYSSTVRCPAGEVILAGAMTMDQENDRATGSVLIFVRAMVHTIEEDTSDWNDKKDVKKSK